MNWKDKIKTAVITATTVLLTSCGFGKKANSGPIERPLGIEAKGNVQDALFEYTANGDNVSEAQLQNIINSQQGQNFSDNFRADLKNAHIYMSKKDANGETLVLTSVDKLSYEENGRMVTEYENPQYGPNEIKSNVEIKNGVEVHHAEPISFEADTLTAGIHHEGDKEYVDHEVKRARQLLIKKENLHGVAPGDTVNIDGVKGVVGKGGKVEAQQTTKITVAKKTLVLDYAKGKMQKTSGSSMN